MKDTFPDFRASGPEIAEEFRYESLVKFIRSVHIDPVIETIDTVSRYKPIHDILVKQ